MYLQLFEVTNTSRLNWGKIAVGRFNNEWEWRSVLEAAESPDPVRMPLIRQVGWTPQHLMVFDLQTGEGAMFHPGGNARADLNKKRIWVCPMFEPFLRWLYQQDLRDLTKLPSIVVVDHPGALHGYRRSGPRPPRDLRQLRKRLQGARGRQGRRAPTLRLDSW